MRKVLVCGLICLVVAAGAAAYITDFGLDDLLPQRAPVVQKIDPPPRPAFLDKNLATLEEPIEAAITADLPAIAQMQESRRWGAEGESLIPSKNIVEGKQAVEELVSYRLKVVDAYRRGTQDPKEVQRAAVAFLDRYNQAAGSQQGDFKVIREMGDAAIKGGSTDPLVVTYHARSKLNLEEIPPGDAYATFKKVLDELGDGAYPPPILRFQLKAWNADLANRTAVAGAPAAVMRQLAFQEAARFLAHESGAENPAILLSFVQNTLRFNNDVPEQRLELFQACLTEPKIDPYIHHMLGGEYYLKLAWDSRGDGYASSVTRDGWKKFGELMPRAARHFRRAWFLRPELPYAAQRMIMVTRAGGDESWLTEDWFHASVVAQFDYHEAYDSYMFVLMPRWGGSHQRMANFAKECIATDRWYTNVPAEAAQALRLIAMDSDSSELLGKNPAAERIASAYVDAFSAAKERGEVRADDFADMLATMTATLVQAGNFQQARKGFDIGPESNDWWWSIDRGVGYRYSMGLSHAITGPAETSVKPIHEFLTREAVEAPSVGAVEDMQKRLEDARAADSNPKSAGFYDIAGQMLGQLKAYAAGEWVDLTFDQKMTLWMSRAASYDLLDPKTLRLTGTQNSQMQLKPLTRFAPPYMVEAEIKVVTASGELPAGIVVGAMTWRSEAPFPQLLSAGPHITSYFEYRQRKGQPSAANFDLDGDPGDGFQHLAIRRYPGETRMYAMHGLFLADRNEDPLNDFILFGDLHTPTGFTGEAVFRNLRIRRAPPKVTGRVENPKTLPALLEAVDYYPECPEARKVLADALMQQGRLTESLEQVARSKAIYRKIVDLHRIEGAALCGTGKYEAALEAFREEYRLFSYTVWPKVHEAWVLATAPDEKLRDGQKALELVTSLKAQKDDRLDVWSFRVTEAVVAAQNKQFEEAKELAKAAEEAADSEYRRAIARRVRQVIDQDLPYRMPEGGEIPPPPAAKSVKKPKPAEATSDSEPQSPNPAGAPAADPTST
jgi:tetratricopeptide (TPR) repeat protein